MLIKLASEKSFNRGICPVMNIKGKIVSYPFVVQYKNFGFRCDQGMLGPKHMMVMDIIGTSIIHKAYGNQSFYDRIPSPKDNKIKKISALYMSHKLLKFMTENLSVAHKGMIPAAWYSDDEKLYHIDRQKPRIKKALEIKLNDGILRKQLPFLRNYSSLQIKKMFYDLAKCVVRMNFPIRYFDGKEYQTVPFKNSSIRTVFFTGESYETKISKNDHVLEREYLIRMDSIWGYLFAQNMMSAYMDLVPGIFYEMSDYAQLFYRFFVMPYFPNIKSGKSPKNPISLEEIRKRLVLKTRDKTMVRKIIKRILDELADQKFISSPKEEKMLGGDYMYRYRKNTWQDITGEKETSENDLDDLGN